MCLDEKENHILAVEIVVWGYTWAPHYCGVWGICGDTCGVGGPGQNIHVLCMEEDSSCTNYRCVLQNAYDLLNQTQ